MNTEKYLVGNDFISSDEVIEIKNPFSGQVVKKVFKTTKEDVNKSLNYLTSAFEKFKKVPVYQRYNLLDAITKKISERKEFLAETITQETGKPIKFSRIEIDRAILTFRTGAEESKRIEGETIDLDLLRGSENKIAIIRRFPIGVIFAITPWNFPVNLVAHKISPALASGNVILLKPATASLVSGIEIGKIIKEASEETGFDFCPVNVITSSGSEAEFWLSDSRIKMISFTGSPLVGWGIKRKISHQRISLELGGNAGVIVDKTADLQKAASKIALAAFAVAGQSCISVQRVFVHKDISEKFTELLISETKKIKFGNPFDENTITGPMINTAEAERVERWIGEAMESNATIITGGKREGAVFEPTIVKGASRESNLNSKEVFAPLLTLRDIDDFKQGVEEINNSDFGLQAGLFTNDLRNALYSYENIETGGVVVNDVPTYRMDTMPYGGVKHSGIGKEGIKYAIEEMTERKVFVIDKINDL